MKSVLILFCLIIFSGVIMPQNSGATTTAKKYTIVTDSMSGAPMILGYCNRQALKDTSFSWWFESMYDLYKVDSTTAKECTGLLKNVNIKIVMGTWCSDSRREVPRFFKVMDYIKYPSDNVSIIAVGRNKLGQYNDVKGLNIKLIPTFIFYRNNKELGRIVESPKVSLEKDMLKILKG